VGNRFGNPNKNSLLKIRQVNNLVKRKKKFKEKRKRKRRYMKTTASAKFLVIFFASNVAF